MVNDVKSTVHLNNQNIVSAYNYIIFEDVQPNNRC
jgi:hypothetical protein